MNHYQSLVDAVERAEAAGFPCKLWAAGKAKNELTAALCVCAISECSIGIAPGLTLDRSFDEFAAQLEKGEPLAFAGDQPTELVLAALDAAGLWPDTVMALRFQVAESRDCIIVLVNGRSICALPVAQWRQSLQKARGL